MVMQKQGINSYKRLIKMHANKQLVNSEIWENSSVGILQNISFCVPK